LGNCVRGRGAPGLAKKGGAEMELGARLRAARLAARLSQRGLAQQVGVTHAAISKYERGLDMPSLGVLGRLSRALGVTTEYFFRTFEAQVELKAARHAAKLGARDMKAVAARVAEQLERYMAAEHVCPSCIHEDKASPPPSWTVASVEEIEAVARDLRSDWQLGDNPIQSMTELLERQGIRIVEIKGIKRLDAQLFWANATDLAIAVNGEHPGDRQRFSLAHELGHLVLQVIGNIDPEKAANRFAGAFLVPRSVAVGMLGRRRSALELRELHLLKHAYGFSMQAWVYRAKDLGIVSESLYGRWYREFRRAHGTHEPGKPYPQEHPAQAKRLVMQAYAEGTVTASRAAELLGESLGAFRKQLRETGDDQTADCGHGC